MQNQSYYWPQAREDDRFLPERPLYVNCAGCCVMERPFVTLRPEGRKDYYLLYLRRGELTAELPGGSALMRPGQLLLYLPGQRQRYEAAKAACYDWVHFTGNAAGEMTRGFGLEARRIIELGEGSEDAVHAAFLSLFEEFIRGDAMMEAALAARLGALCLTLARQREEYQNIGRGRLKPSLKHIHAHYQEQISVSELAMLEGLSLSQFRNTFKRATGLSPLTYLTTLRMKRACELLRQTNLSVGEVAEAVGYPDPLYFSRVFKKRMGEMPSAFREG